MRRSATPRTANFQDLNAAGVDSPRRPWLKGRVDRVRLRACAGPRARLGVRRVAHRRAGAAYRVTVEALLPNIWHAGQPLALRQRRVVRGAGRRESLAAGRVLAFRNARRGLRSGALEGCRTTRRRRSSWPIFNRRWRDRRQRRQPLLLDEHHARWGAHPPRRASKSTPGRPVFRDRVSSSPSAAWSATRGPTAPWHRRRHAQVPLSPATAARVSPDPHRSPAELVASHAPHRRRRRRRLSSSLLASSASRCTSTRKVCGCAGAIGVHSAGATVSDYGRWRNTVVGSAGRRTRPAMGERLETSPTAFRRPRSGVMRVRDATAGECCAPQVASFRPARRGPAPAPASPCVARRVTCWCAPTPALDRESLRAAHHLPPCRRDLPRRRRVLRAPATCVAGTPPPP